MTANQVPVYFYKALASLRPWRPWREYRLRIACAGLWRLPCPFLSPYNWHGPRSSAGSWRLSVRL